ncbi:Aste57867_1066 [Aphanomyces stellatus]|uniref:beta-glucosidase n=1 Tax=Aphanomyces stellatus TaxID=120398 RepID=A0A485K9C9_9STRA|nr:hypothetical protein As57867_001065 [Aphanomyces stellatus]VFT78288.1 Aste57867_1066 [Aphanomyces stellatus]
MKVFLPLVLVSTVATAQSNDDKAWAIVNKLTSDQLLGQMNQLSIGTIQKDTPNGKVLDMTKVQANAKRFAGSYSILGASYLYNAVLFPAAINSGATFNPALVEEYGKFKGRDTKAAGVPIGLECMKHLAKIQLSRVLQGYSDPVSGDDRDGAVLTDYDVLNHFVPSFDEAGIKTGMGTYIGINGVQLAANEKMHKGLLRHDLNFQGTMATDFAEISLIGPDLLDDYEQSLNKATYDIIMKIQLDRLKQSVQRQIKLKYDLGLFDTPVPGADLVSLVCDKASEDAALATARESLVLLKNKNNVLPLAPSASVFLTGPSMDDIGLLGGGWTYQ